MRFTRLVRNVLLALLFGLLVAFTVATQVPRISLSLSVLTALRPKCPQYALGWQEIRNCNEAARAPVCPHALSRLANTAVLHSASEARLSRLISFACEDDGAVVTRFETNQHFAGPLTSADIGYVSQAYERLGRIEEARSLWSKDRGIAVWFIGQGVSAIEKRRDEEAAIVFFEKAESVLPGAQPSKIAMYQYLCSFSARDGRDRVIENACQYYTELDPSNKTQLLLGQYYFQQAEFDEASNAFRAALRFDAASVSAYDWLSRALSESGDILQAEQTLLKGLDQVGFSAQLYIRLAQLELRKGCANKATKYLEQVLRSSQDQQETQDANDLLALVRASESNAQGCE